MLEYVVKNMLKTYSKKRVQYRNISPTSVEMKFSKFILYIYSFSSDGNMNPTTCLLCQESLENITHLRIHLLSQQHRDREHQIRFKAPAI